MIKRITEKLLKKMKWYDISLTKLSTFFGTLLLITAFPQFLAFVLQFEWYWYLILMIVVAIPVMRKLW